MLRGSKRAEILDFVRDFITSNGYSPTVREVCIGTGLRSTASAYYHLQELARIGKIFINENKKRAISLPEEPRMGQIPVVGVVAAGVPIMALENIEGYIPWPYDSKCFALRVKGDSMVDAGILPGDKVIVRPQPTAENGEIVVALLGDEATVKRLSIGKDGVWLMPENDAYEPIDGSYATIVGKVRGVMREY